VFRVCFSARHSNWEITDRLSQIRACRSPRPSTTCPTTCYPCTFTLRTLTTPTPAVLWTKRTEQANIRYQPAIPRILLRDLVNPDELISVNILNNSLYITLTFGPYSTAFGPYKPYNNLADGDSLGCTQGEHIGSSSSFDLFLFQSPISLLLIQCKHVSTKTAQSFSRTPIDSKGCMGLP
jgi:hypothetical protein